MKTTSTRSKISKRGPAEGLTGTITKSVLSQTKRAGLTYDIVDRASNDSFPASDAPAWINGSEPRAGSNHDNREQEAMPYAQSRVPDPRRPDIKVARQGFRDPMRRRHIILATDLSARCDRAFERAVLLARECDARLTVVHALEERGERFDRGVSSRWRRNDRAKLDAESQIMVDLQRAGIAADVVVRRGSASELIVELARKTACDLIVTGIARDLGLARAILGSTLEALARENIAPVLIVKRPARDPYDSAVVGTNFSKGSRAAIQATLQLLPQAKVTALHAYRPPLEGFGGVQITDQAAHGRLLNECTRFVADAAPAARREIRCLAELGFPETLLKQYVLDRKVDLMVVGTEVRNPMAAFLLGSTSRSLILSSPCDLLLVPANWTSSTGDARGASHRPEWRIARASRAGTHEGSVAADARDRKPARP